jgi:opacity protein-like surface antigen
VFRRKAQLKATRRNFLKAKLVLITLVLITVVAFGGLAQAQGKLSHLSLAAGFEGIFPGSTFTKDQAEAFNTAKTQSTTNSVGAVGDLRVDFGHHSAFDIAVTVNRNSELFFNSVQSNVFGGILTRVQTNNAEVIASYIFRFPARPHVRPYALIGGGAVRFSPNNAFTTSNVPVTQTKPAFAYGFGCDVPFGDHLGLRLQYRGLIRSEPDFGLLTTEPFGTGLKTHVPEPSVQVLYHF